MNEYVTLIEAIENGKKYLEDNLEICSEERDAVVKILWHSFIDAFLTKLQEEREGKHYQFFEDPKEMIGSGMMRSIENLLTRELLAVFADLDISELDKIELTENIQMKFVLAAETLKNALSPVFEKRSDKYSSKLELDVAVYGLKIRSRIIINKLYED